MRHFTRTFKIVCASVVGLFAASSLFAQVPIPIPQLKPPHGELPPTYWEQHGGQTIGAVVVFLILAAAIIWWLRRPRNVVIEAPAVIARRALEQLRARQAKEVLVVEVSRILRRYLIYGLALPPDELTTTEFYLALRTHRQIGAELAKSVNAFLRRCDERKFSPQPPSEAWDAVGEANELVGQIETAKQSMLTEGAVA
jgi:hypothetical protein